MFNNQLQRVPDCQGNTSGLKHKTAIPRDCAHPEGAWLLMELAAGDGATPRSAVADVEALYHACAVVFAVSYLQCRWQSRPRFCAQRKVDLQN
jgi:hypothetical protein